MAYSIAILGAGALGALYANELGSSPEVSCFFIAGGERAARLRSSGITVNGRRIRAEVRGPEEAVEADLLLVALKYHNLPEALPLADPFAGEHTTILSVMNGVDSEEIIARRFGSARLLYTVALGMDAVREGSEVRYTTSGKLVTGKPGARGAEAENDPDIIKIRTICGLAGMPLEISGDILKAMWWKFMINIGVNQVSAITGAPYRFFQDRNSDAHALMLSAMREVILVARAKGIDLSEADIEAWHTVLDRLGPDGKTSMLQDVEAGRKTEVEMFAGILLEYGREVGLELPVNRMLLQLIRSREAAAGLPDVSF